MKLIFRNSDNYYLSKHGYTRAWIFMSMLVVMLSGCKSHKQEVSGVPSQEVVDANASLSDLQISIVEEAMTWMGTPYQYAGENKGRGTDCSGMVMKVYETATGERLPRNSAKQSEYCRTISRKDVQTADLVFFATGKDPSKVSHVGIMLDSNRFIHASSSKGVVISDINTPYYVKTLKKFGRVPIEALLNQHHKERNKNNLKRR